MALITTITCVTTSAAPWHLPTALSKSDPRTRALSKVRVAVRKPLPGPTRAQRDQHRRQEGTQGDWGAYKPPCLPSKGSAPEVAQGPTGGLGWHVWTSRCPGRPRYLIDQCLSMAEEGLTDPGHANQVRMLTLGLLAVVDAPRQQRRVDARGVTRCVRKNLGVGDRLNVCGTCARQPAQPERGSAPTPGIKRRAATFVHAETRPPRTCAVSKADRSHRPSRPAMEREISRTAAAHHQVTRR